MKKLLKQTCVLAVLVVGAGASSAAIAGGNEAFTYEATYKTVRAVSLRAGPGVGTGTVREIGLGASGIVLRYCAPELSTGSWYFAGAKGRLKLLAPSICQVSYKGSIGFLDGKDLTFD